MNNQIMESKNFLYKPYVVYQDNHLLIMNKPSGMPVVPDSSGDFSLLDHGKAYLKYTRNKPGNVFLAVIHRIDRPVSGLVCFAVTSKAASRLSSQLRLRQIKKTYVAISQRKPGVQKGRIENLLVKDRKKNVVTETQKESKGAKLSVTDWEVLLCNDSLCLFRLYPVTGRPHQLRVHMAGMGCPIFGDKKYGSRSRFLKGRGIALHSYSLGIQHPVRNEKMEFTCPLPGVFPYNVFNQDLS